MDIEQIAAIAHEVNRAHCISLNDHSQPAWADAPEWIKQSAYNGVRFLIDNPNAPASASHDNWLEYKRSEGWTYGEEKDPEAKTHPCMVEYDDLPFVQKMKDTIFRSVVLGCVAYNPD